MIYPHLSIISKIEAGKIDLNCYEFDLLNLLETTRDMLQLNADAKGINLLFEWHPETPRYIQADERKLRQILINLLNNAIKFTTHGSVTVRVKPDESQTPRLIFEIEDTGAGIKEEEFDTLFKPFTQTQIGIKSHEGTGLGLSISRKFVRLMDGDLNVTSQLGIGSIFSFNILYEPAKKSLPDQQVTKEVIGLAANQPDYRILVVDDNQDHRQVVVQLLESIGFDVQVAVNGKEAVEIWQDWQPDLICMDMQMSVLDGSQATQIIKSQDQGKNTVIIALTANVFEIPANNLSNFTPKPFSVIEPTAEDLEVMTVQWLNKIQEAAQIADCQILQQLITEIEDEYDAIAIGLNHWLDEFRIDKIAQVAEKALLNKLYEAAKNR